MTSMPPDFREAFLEPLTELLGPHHRVFAPFVLTSLLLAAYAWRRARRRARDGGPPGPSLLRYLFPRKLLLHRSSRLDIVWLFVRGVTQALLAWPLRISVLGVALVVCGNVRDVVGPTPAPPIAERGALFVAFSIGLFLADDLSRYLVHRLMHRLPALWELHKVHHSAEVLTPLTLYRVHPVESWMNRMRGALSAGLVTGLFMWLFPGKLRAFEVLGIDALGFVWTAFGANLRHSHVWLGFPAWAERWVISPAQHQMHHARSSSIPPGNYGSALALWDRVFGTLLLSEGRRPMRVGLPRAERNHAPTPLSMLVSPVRASLRVLWPGVSTSRAPGDDATPVPERQLS
jgi:sterol desaturase/sphingolipid hydroxylase (fatty acid hydroxylase superfamily)